MIDEASSKVRLKSHTTPSNLKEIEQEIEKVKNEKDAAVHAQEFENAANLRDKQSKLEKQYEDAKMNGRHLKADNQHHYLKKILLKLLQDGQGFH